MNIHTNNKKIMSICSFVIIFIVLAIPQTFASGSSETELPDFEYCNNTINNDNEFYLIDITLPEAFINEKAEADVKAYIGAPFSDFKQYKKSGEFFLKWEYIMNVSVQHNSAVISYVAEGSAFTGGNHPAPLYRVFNYSKKTGRPLFISDIVKSEKTLEVLSEMIKKDEMVDIQFGWEEGVSPDPENWKYWLVEGDKISFVFPPYQIDPYCNGPTEWYIPITDELFKTELLY